MNILAFLILPGFVITAGILGRALHLLTLATLAAVGRVAAVVLALAGSAFLCWLASTMHLARTLDWQTGPLLLLVAANVGVACLHLWRAEGARAWPVAAGTVLSADLHEETDGDGDTRVIPRVAYTYAVGDRSYLGRSVEFTSRTFSSRAAALGAGFDFEAGAPVWVHLDPSDPGRSVLRPGASKDQLTCSYFASGMAIVALAVGEGTFATWTLFVCTVSLLGSVRPGVARSLPSAQPAVAPPPPARREPVVMPDGKLTCPRCEERVRRDSDTCAFCGFALDWRPVATQ